MLVQNLTTFASLAYHSCHLKYNSSGKIVNLWGVGEGDDTFNSFPPWTQKLVIRSVYSLVRFSGPKKSTYRKINYIMTNFHCITLNEKLRIWVTRDTRQLIAWVVIEQSQWN